MGETGYTRDSERIILALYEQDQLGTRDLAEEAGLGSTQAVHYRYKTYLGPNADALVEKAASEPGKESEWSLTDAGQQWAETNFDDIKVPQTDDEAVEIAAEALERAESALSAAGTTAGEFQQLEERVSVAIGEIRETAQEARDDAQSGGAQSRDAAWHGVQNDVGDLKDDVEDLDRKLSNLSESLDGLRSSFYGVKERFNKRGDRMATQKNLNRLADRVGDVESQADAIQKSVDEIESTDFGELEARVQQLDNNVSEYAKRTVAVEESVAALKSAVDGYEDAYSDDDDDDDDESMFDKFRR